MKAFHNTIGEKDNIATRYDIVNQNQNKRVMDIFITFGAMTPMEVMEKYNDRFHKVPLTSIRRAITDLTKDGRLIKTTEKKLECLGKPNYKWILNSEYKDSRVSLFD